MAITIVGLGAGDGRYITREAWGILEAAEQVFVRTVHHPAVAELNVARSFDELYETGGEYGDVYRGIVEVVMEAGRVGDVVYAVPGDPFVGEAAVKMIQERGNDEGVDVRVVAGLSFVEPTLAVLGVDAFDGLQIFDALVIGERLHPPVSADVPLLIGQVYNRLVAGEVKLTLMEMFTAEHPVVLVHGAGTDGAVVERVPLFEIDRSEQIGHLTSLFVPQRERPGALSHFADTIAVLRSPDGCPWDRKQTMLTMRASFMEEVAEALDAIEADDMDNLREELGDVLLHIVMLAQMGSEEGAFNVTDVIEGINAKIVRRHPHVWGDTTVENSDAVVESWAAIKAREKAKKGIPEPESVLEGVPMAWAALAQSQKIQKRARKVGFDWPTVDGVWAKLDEEIGEVKAAETAEELEDEIGDMLFVIANLALWLEVDAEMALRGANRKFSGRFRGMEKLMQERGVTFGEVDLEFMERLWREVKKGG